MGKIVSPEGVLAGGAGAAVQGQMFAGKAAITSATANTAYSLLNAEQIPEFFSLVPEGQNVMSADSQMINVKGPELDLATINFANGQFVGGKGSTTALGAAEQAVATFGGVAVNPQAFEARVEFETTRLPNWNIAGAGLESQIETLIATYYFNQLEEVFISSDTAGTDPAGYGSGSMTTIDGWVTQAISGAHVYDHGDGYVNASLFENLFLQLPVKYRANAPLRSKLKFYVASDVESTYHFWLTQRQTGLGDLMLDTDGTMRYKGIPIVGVPSMTVDAAGVLTRENYEAASGRSYALLCEPTNKLIGYNPEMRVFKHPRDDGKVTYINIYGEYDVAYKNIDAVGIAVNVVPTIDPAITTLA